MCGAFSLQKRGRPPRPRQSDFVTGEELEDEEEDFAEAEGHAPQRSKRKREASAAAAAAAAEDLTLIGKRLLLSVFLSFPVANAGGGFGIRL